MTPLNFAGAARPWKVIIGAGKSSQQGWISTNQAQLDLLKPAMWTALLGSETADALLAEHVWHMLSRDDGYFAARVSFEFLSSGGHLRVAVPDGFHPDLDYLNWVRPNGTGPSAPAHRVLYDYRSLQALLRDAGFAVSLVEYFDEERVFHGNPWKAEDGFVRRSARFDARNAGGALKYTSLIADARKRA